jgi:Lon protease-like protein
MVGFSSPDFTRKSPSFVLLPGTILNLTFAERIKSVRYSVNASGAKRFKVSIKCSRFEFDTNKVKNKMKAKSPYNTLENILNLAS